MKIQIIERIIDELRLAQTRPWTALQNESSTGLRLPPALPLPDGRLLHATDDLLVAVLKYATLWINNKPELKIRLKVNEFERIVHESFGVVLAGIDLDLPAQYEIGDVKNEIDREIIERVEQNGERLEVVLGCELLKTFEIYPIVIGPVTFQTKAQWSARALKNGEISDVCARRLNKAWSGGRLRKRKTSRDSMKEDSIADSIGSSSTVCTVMCDGLSWKMINEKSLLAARLAMSALSLIWQRPSAGLQWMNLLYDGNLYHKHYVLFGANGRHGSSSSISQMSEGVCISEDFPESIKDHAGTLEIIGEVLQTYVQPRHASKRPAVLNAVFLGLWWFHEGCREPSDQIATTKFSASMDALSGGKKMKGIVSLIGARIGPKANEKLMNDGQTTTDVMKNLYNVGRSRLIHGSSENYAHDWTTSRSTAEVIARLCLVGVTSWLSENPNVDNIEQASEVRK